MGNYVENNLGKNEEIVEKVKINYLAIVPKIIAISVFVAITLILSAFLEELFVKFGGPGELKYISFLFLIPAIVSFFNIFGVLSIEIAVTNKRIVGKSGVFGTYAIDIPLNQVSNATLSSTFFGKIFNYATIEISSTGMKIVQGNSVPNRIVAVKNSRDFLNAINEAIENNADQQRKLQAEELAKAMQSNATTEKN